MDSQLIINGENIRGMNKDKKRMDYFSWLKTKSDRDFTIVTETKCHDMKDMASWAKEWSCNEKDSIWSLDTGKTGKKGVTILIHPKFNRRADAKIVNTRVDPNGRWVKIIINIGKETFRIIGIYAPNNSNERINFFQVELHKIMESDHISAENIMCGDYNCTMNTELDRFNCISANNDSGQKDLLQFIKKYELEDIWRTKNPKEKKFTYFGDNKGSRIDYWLTSLSLTRQIEDVDTYYNSFSDHHGIKLVIETKTPKIGKGIWKMNNSHIVKPEYKEELTNMWQNWQERKYDYLDITQWWDLGKINIKELSRNFAIEQSILNRSKIDELEIEITHLSNSNSDNNKLEMLKNEHRTLLSTNCEGARIRSRIKWWEEGEKSTKYFHDLEKSKAKSKTWDCILDENKQLIYGTKNIQKRQVRFYKELFTSEVVSNDHSFFLDHTGKQLPPDLRDSLEIDLSNEEVISAIKKMANDKSPGQDGITIEFYKTHWNLIGDDVFRYGLEHGEIAYSQYLAIITLLYKKGPRENIRNWRPISLLNVDYKILSKVFAERLKKVLPYIIHSDQKGCIAGRNIGENVRLIEDLLYEIENMDLESVIFLKDDEKAFDRVEWGWLFSTLKHFGFGDNFIKWLKIMYKNSKSSILTNGFQSEFFNITRGIRQGDSLSALLYILQMEPLAEKIRQINSIKGVTINLKNLDNENIEARGCQYVDDSTSFLENKEYITKLVAVLNRYENVSGSKTNLDKTVALVRKGLSVPKKVNDIKLLTGPERVLGVPIGGNDPTNNELWSNLIAKMKQTLQIWQRRDLSLEGKAYIIKSIGVSKLLFALNLKTIENKHKKEIEDIFWNFLWKGKSFRFNRRICTLPMKMGGLGLVDINILEKVKRINWVIRVLKDEKRETWSKMVENYLRCLDNQFGIKLFALKVTDSRDLILKAKIPKFYKECVIFFQELNKIARVNLKEELIWCNNKIRFQNKPLTFFHWARDNILRPSQLYRNGQLFLRGIFDKLTHKAGFTFEQKTISTVFSKHRTDQPIFQGSGIENDDKEDILNSIFKVTETESKCLKDLTSKDIYNIFLFDDQPPILSKTYWSVHKFPGHNFDWEVWGLYNLTNPILPRKVKGFMFHHLHGTLYLESKLRHMKHKNGTPYSDGLCKACHSRIENLEHMLECQYRRKIWTLIEQIINTAFGWSIKLNRLEILTGYLNDDIDIDHGMILNMVLCMTRYEIWLCRNSIRNDEVTVSFEECYIKLKHYLLSHIRILELSKNTKPKLKTILIELTKSINIVLRNGLLERNI